MGRRMVSTTCYLDAEQVDLLHVLSDRTKVPIAEYIRQGVDLVLAAAEKGPVPYDRAAWDAVAWVSVIKQPGDKCALPGCGWERGASIHGDSGCGGHAFVER